MFAIINPAIFYVLKYYISQCKSLSFFDNREDIIENYSAFFFENTPLYIDKNLS